MTQKYDAIVVGAGVAGLAATSELVRQGAKVLCLEATGRLGGRILTKHEPGAPLPVELGAEFIHGRPPELWNRIQNAGLGVYQHGFEAIHLENGWVRTRQQTGESAETLLKKLLLRGTDRTLHQSMEQSRRSVATKKWAVAHIEGFNAASQERISVAALKKDAKAADEIAGDCIFRLLHGYDAIPIDLMRSIPDPTSVIWRHQVVEGVQWESGRVRVSVQSVRDDRRYELQSSRLVIAVPLGILQAAAGERGAIHFDPEPVQVLRATRRLEIGHVYRVTLRFREPFWEEDSRFKSAAFLVSREPVFPTWWTPHPVVAPLLTGWSAGPAAAPLHGKARETVIHEALSSLSNILKRDIPLPVAAYFHDWSADPFFRGAYSYVPVGAVRVRNALARPVEETLFFAGEATNTEGHGGTVHGAFSTGLRAAHQVFSVFRKR